MTLTQYNTTVGHTGIARLCLAQKCYRTRTKLAEVGKPPPLQDDTEKLILHAIYSIVKPTNILYFVLIYT